MVEYCKQVLSPEELNSLDNIFLGDSIEEYFEQYLQEQDYIRSEAKK